MDQGREYYQRPARNLATAVDRGREAFQQAREREIKCEPTGELFLGIIAFSVLIMALIQVGAIFAGIRLAKRVDQLATQLDQEIKPLLANLTHLTGEAARAASLAAKQAERFDRVFAELCSASTARWPPPEEFVTGPARQGMAIVAGIKAVIDSFQGLREASRRRAAARPAVEEEESLFIG